MATSTARASSTRAGAPSCRYDQSTRCTGWWIGASAGRRPRGRTSSRRTRSEASRTASAPGARPRSASRRRPSPASTTRTPRTSPSTRRRRRLPLRGLRSSRRAPSPAGVTNSPQFSYGLSRGRPAVPSRVLGCPARSLPPAARDSWLPFYHSQALDGPTRTRNALLLLRAEHKARRVIGLGIS